jgi:hypothetical protein
MNLEELTRLDPVNPIGVELLRSSPGRTFHIIMISIISSIVLLCYSLKSRILPWHQRETNLYMIDLVYRNNLQDDHPLQRDENDRPRVAPLDYRLYRRQAGRVARAKQQSHCWDL